MFTRKPTKLEEKTNVLYALANLMPHMKINGTARDHKNRVIVEDKIIEIIKSIKLD